MCEMRHPCQDLRYGAYFSATLRHPSTSTSISTRSDQTRIEFHKSLLWYVSVGTQEQSVDTKLQRPKRGRSLSHYSSPWSFGFQECWGCPGLTWDDGGVCTDICASDSIHGSRTRICLWRGGGRGKDIGCVTGMTQSLGRLRCFGWVSRWT